MAVPFLKNQHLFYPIKTTSPSLITDKNTIFNDIKLKNCMIKAVNISNTTSVPDFYWDGTKKEWTEDITVINSDFVKNDSLLTDNILYNTNFSSIKKYNNFNKVKDWNIIAEGLNTTYQDKKNQNIQLIYNMNETGEYLNNQIYSEQFLKENYYSPIIETREFGDGFNLVLKNTKNIRLGIRQCFIKSEDIFSSNYLSFSFKLRTNTSNCSVVARITYYDENGFIIDSQKTNGINNKNASISIKVKGIFETPENWKYAAFDIFMDGGSTIGPTALIREIQLEYGENTNPIWEINHNELSLDLNAGEIPAPLDKNGLIKENDLIKEFAILRSTLSDNIHSWEEIKRIKSSNINKLLFNDYFIENGDYYRYAIQPIFSNGRKGNITIYKDIISTYEGLWILGKDNLQFNFIYNGQITNIASSKKMELVNTIESKYPYFVSNSSQDYKTFNLSGTLCQNQDIEELFLDNNFSKTIANNTSSFNPSIEDKYIYEKNSNPKTDLYNDKNSMVMQRRWREQIFEWLNNGEPKVIKSEAQGCFVVMIDSVVIQPNKQTYGLIADFSAKCTEIGEFSEEQLKKLKLR